MLSHTLSHKAFLSQHRDIILIAIAYGVFAIGGALFWAAIPIFGHTIFSLTQFAAGLLMASMGVVYVIFDGLTGHMLDYIGYKKGALLSIYISLVAAALLIANPSLPFFVAAIFIYAFGWNVLSQSTGAYVLYNAPSNHAGRLFGIYGSLNGIGTLIATFYIASVADWGIERVGLFFLATSLSTLFILLLIRSEVRRFEAKISSALKSYWHSPSLWREGLEAMKEHSPISWIHASDGFVRSTLTASIWFVIPLSLVSFQNEHITEGFMLGAFEIGGILAMVLASFLVDRYSKKHLFLFLLFFQAVVLTGLAFSHQPIVFIALAVLSTAIGGAAKPAINALLSAVDKRHNADGTLFGFITMISDIGFVVGPILGGILFGLLGLQGVLFFLCGLLWCHWLISSLALMRFTEKADRSNSHTQHHLVHISLGRHRIKKV